MLTNNKDIYKKTMQVTANYYQSKNIFICIIEDMDSYKTYLKKGII